MESTTKDTGVAPEQYELREKLPYTFNMNRRTFFNALGSGIAIVFSVSKSIGAAVADVDSTIDDKDLAAWIHINEKSEVTIYTGKAEVGQNIRTSLAQIVAEELHVPMESINMVMGDTALTPYDRGTFGSRSIPYMGPQLRKAAATAREILIGFAADEWKADRASLTLENGEVKERNSQRAMPIGKLMKGKEFMKPVDDNVTVTPTDEWKITGTSVRKVNSEAFLTGKHLYTSDMNLPDMLYGKILRPPAYGATLVSCDASAAKKMKDVTVVQDGDFIGVTAPNLYTATQALKAIRAEWKTIAQTSRSELFQHLKSKAGKPEGRGNETAGNVTSAFASATVKIEQSFTIDYIAHVPMETRGGIAQWIDQKLTVWTGTQRPFGVQEDLAELFHIPKESIRVIQPDTGSGYGGKHTGEAGIEAARLARDAGKPVKVVWTREEEFTWAYFRPAGVIEVKAGASADGIVTAWEFHNYNSGGSGIETPYEVSNKQIQFHPSDSPLRQGSYRGLAATANVFARESIMNDLAEALKIDPLEFRLKNLREQRMKDVLEAAAKTFRWKDGASAPGHGVGIACGTEKGSYVATCAEVSVKGKNVTVERAVVAFECGAIVNPEHLRNQIEGAVIQGLGGALFESIDFKDGKILNAALSKYRVPRFGDIPKLEVVMLNRKDIPSAGAGETPILGIAPAIRNAIANATGKKLYTLPMVPEGETSRTGL